MVRNIRFFDGFGRFDVPRFWVSDNEALTVKIIRPAGVPESHVLMVEYSYCGVTRRETLGKDGKFTISPQWLNEVKQACGAFHSIDFALTVFDDRGATPLSFHSIEPLTLLETDGAVSFSAPLQELEARVEALEAEALGERLTKLEKQHEDIL